jgi:hypothetical protein
MNPLTAGDRALAWLLPMAVAIACYLAWSLRKGRITLRSLTSIRKKQPFEFWWDFVMLALFDCVLWFVAARGLWAVYEFSN